MKIVSDGEFRTKCALMRASIFAPPEKHVTFTQRLVAEEGRGVGS